MSAAKNQPKAAPKAPETHVPEHPEDDADFDPDDPCVKKEVIVEEPKRNIVRGVGEDPR